MKREHEMLMRQLSDQLTKQNDFMQYLVNKSKSNSKQNQLISFEFRNVVASRMGLVIYCTYCGNNPHERPQRKMSSLKNKDEYSRQKSLLKSMNRTIFNRAIRHFLKDNQIRYAPDSILSTTASPTISSVKATLIKWSIKTLSNSLTPDSQSTKDSSAFFTPCSQSTYNSSETSISSSFDSTSPTLQDEEVNDHWSTPRTSNSTHISSITSITSSSDTTSTTLQNKEVNNHSSITSDSAHKSSITSINNTTSTTLPDENLLETSITSSSDTSTTLQDEEINVHLSTSSTSDSTHTDTSTTLLNKEVNVDSSTSSTSDSIHTDTSTTLLNKEINVHSSTSSTSDSTHKLPVERFSARLRNKSTSKSQNNDIGLHDPINVSTKTIDVNENQNYNNDLVNDDSNNINTKCKSICGTNKNIGKDKLPVERFSARLRNNSTSNLHDQNQNNINDPVNDDNNDGDSEDDIIVESYDKQNSLVSVEHSMMMLRVINSVNKAQAKLVDDWDMCPAYSMIYFKEFMHRVCLKNPSYEMNNLLCVSITLLCSLILCGSKQTIHNINHDNFPTEVSVYLLFFINL
jgi:hypothetical protein